jgi:adenylylsulfate kinase
MSAGTVYWVTGLSGAGKSTLSELLRRRLNERGRPAVILDGDAMRDVMGPAMGHSSPERRTLANRYSRLCRLLSTQGVDVVCATISMFHDCRDWNRTNLQPYVEVYVRVPQEVLASRDPKGIYRRSRAGEAKDVVGIDLNAELPQSPDIIIDNDGRRPPEAVFDELWREIERLKGRTQP